MLKFSSDKKMATYISISGPGIFTETPPYVVDPGVEENLDNLIQKNKNPKI